MSAGTHSHHAHGAHDHKHHGHAPARAHVNAPPALAPSLLRLGLAQRLALAGGLILIIWAMILGVLS